MKKPLKPRKKPRKKPAPKKGGPRSWKRKPPRKKARKKNEPKPAPDPVDPVPLETLNAEQLPPIVRRAHELKARGMYLWEVGEQLQSEFHLASPVSEATVCRWFQEAHEDYLADIKGFRRRAAIETLQSIDAVLRKWLPLATMNNLPLARFVNLGGIRVPVMDENAFEEQIKASAICLRAFRERAVILGLDDGKALVSETEGERSIAELYAYISSIAAKQVTGQLLPYQPPGGEVLELRSGMEDLPPARSNGS